MKQNKPRASTHAPMLADKASYDEKKAFFKRLLTIYGRNAVLEALQQDLTIYCIHFADSNKPAGVLQQIENLANARDIPIRFHNKKELSRISRNSKQDQGIAADIFCPGFQNLADFLQQTANKKQTILALDGITNPQNVGMIIRSACAGEIDAILLPEHGTAQLGPLVIKASAGSLFKAPLIRCENIQQALSECKQANYRIYALSLKAQRSLFETLPAQSQVFVLGNESEGVCAAVEKLCDEQLLIPMKNDVESLNVAVTAGLIAYRNALGKQSE